MSEGFLSRGFTAVARNGLTASLDAMDIIGTHLRWFDHWLKGADNGVEQDKPVKLFVMGLDELREEDDWPLPDTQWRPYYLLSGGRPTRPWGTERSRPRHRQPPKPRTSTSEPGSRRASLSVANVPSGEV